MRPPKTTPGPTTLASRHASQDAEDVSEDSDEENGAPAAAPPTWESPFAPQDDRLENSPQLLAKCKDDLI